ncbi:MAG: hypothetical protein U9Q81_18140 [Pseudomonadota bacterium]|nr:hypothetical protein [Pseudomonadota bacterium]
MLTEPLESFANRAGGEAEITETSRSGKRKDLTLFFPRLAEAPGVIQQTHATAVAVLRVGQENVVRPWFPRSIAEQAKGKT